MIETAIEQFHFIRPFWLLALVPVLFIYWLWRKQKTGFQNWKKLLPDTFYPYLLMGESQLNKSRFMRLLSPVILILSIVALAGPTVQKIEVPVFKAQKARIILLDLSLSMLAEDASPSRLKRAKQKVQDILKQETEGLTGLIAYAGDAHLISPLTDDNETIKNLLPALEPLIMPQLGSRPDKAIELAQATFKDNSVTDGHIIWLTDGIEPHTISDTTNLIKSLNHKLLIIGIGTKEGAPISLRGEYIKDKSGNIVLPRFDASPLKSFTAYGQTSYTDIRYDDLDIRSLKSITRELAEDKNRINNDQWEELGPYLLWLVLPLLAGVFRKGYLISIAIFVPFISPSPVQASLWDDLWQTRDQQGVAAMRENDHEKAETLFKTPAWKGSALYKQGKFEEAAKEYARDKSALGDYNRGNALAKAGKLDDAITAYQSALEKQPDNQDAKDNLALLEQLKQQQENQENQQGDQNQQGDNSQQDEQGQSQDQQAQQNQGQQQDSSQGQNQQSEQQNAEQQQGQQSEEQQQAQQQTGEQSEDEQEKAQQQAAEPAEENQDNDEQQAMQQMQEQKDNENISAEKQMLQQWLRQIPDDPSGLLRRKLQRQSERESNRQEEPVLW